MQSLQILAVIAVIAAIAGLDRFFNADAREASRKAGEKNKRDQLKAELTAFPATVIEAVSQCSEYLTKPAERVLNLSEPIEVEAPLPPGLGQYIPTNVMITYHLQSACSSLAQGSAALLDENTYLTNHYLESAKTSVASALRGKQLRQFDHRAMKGTQARLLQKAQ